MSKESKHLLSCQLGMPVCPVLDQVEMLEKQVETLTRQTRTDTLTGLYNYRQLMCSLENEMERTCRTGSPTGLIALDLDHFKQVNDTWGHEAGNQVLIQTARLLEDCLRKLDMPCRYGGEEVFIVLPGTDLRAAARVAERVRLAIAEAPFVTDQGRIPVTASLGIDYYAGSEDESPETFIQRTDAFLYQAKAAGRNRCCHPDLPEPLAVTSEEKRALFSAFQD